MYRRVLIEPITTNKKGSKMKDTKKQHTGNNAGVDRQLTRHESWRNHRRHIGLKLIKFS